MVQIIMFIISNPDRYEEEEKAEFFVAVLKSVTKRLQSCWVARQLKHFDFNLFWQLLILRTEPAQKSFDFNFFAASDSENRASWNISILILF